MSAVIERVKSARAFEALHALLVEYERQLPVDLRHGAEPALQDVERIYVAPNAAYLARFGADYGGCVAVRAIDAGTAVLQRLYVQPRHRGHGAARALTKAAIEFARERGCSRIVLDTQAARLPAAAALYRSLGFVECEPYSSVDYDDPTFMALELR